MTDWNWQKEAHERYFTANEQGYAHDAQLAIAAALIAMAERKPEFVQVGNHAICIDCIVALWRARDGGLYVHYGGPGGNIALEPDEAAAFLAWWNEHANVTRLDVEEAE